MEIVELIQRKQIMGQLYDMNNKKECKFLKG